MTKGEGNTLNMLHNMGLKDLHLSHFGAAIVQKLLIKIKER
jgi:hypothetical protein